MQQLIFLQWKTELWLPWLLGSLWGVLRDAGQLNDCHPGMTATLEWLPSWNDCHPAHGKTYKTYLLQQSPPKQRMPGIPSALQAGGKCLWQPWELQLVGRITAAVNLLRPLSNHPWARADTQATLSATELRAQLLFRAEPAGPPALRKGIGKSQGP